MAFQDGLSAFLTTWSGVHTAYSFNQTNANTGTDTSHDANSSSYAQADTGNYPNYGLAANCNPDANGDMDIYIITDTCMLLYIPADLATDEYALFHNGGGTHGQMGQIRSESNGTAITLGITHNSDGTNQDYTTVEIEERGWVCVGFQFEDNSGNMAIWVNGSNVAEVSRSYDLKYGSGNPRIGDGAADGIPGWTALEEINGTGLLIANFVCDNPNNDNSSPAGCGDSFYTDYYDEHYVAGGEEHSGVALISGNGSQSGSVKKGSKVSGIISGAGTLIVAAAIGLFGTGVISGNGSQIASGVKATIGAASISGSGSLTATGEAGAENYEGTASISGGGSITASGTKATSLAGAISGSGSLIVSGEVGLRQVATISGNGSLVISAKAGLKQAAIISGSGSLSGSGETARSSDAIISGNGALIASGKASLLGPAVISGSGSLITSGQIGCVGIASISGSGTLAATGSAEEVHSGSAAISSGGTLIGVGLKANVGISAISGNGTLTGEIIKQASGDSAISGGGTLTATGTKAESEEHSGTASISGGGSLSSAGTKNPNGDADISGTGILAGVGTKKGCGEISISGSGQLTGTGEERTILIAIFNGKIDVDNLRFKSKIDTIILFEGKAELIGDLEFKSRIDTTVLFKGEIVL